ncbi:MAG: type II toxin-antitoxin system RelE/ParE family toxin [Acidobacteriota bacterium]|nr:type II toxin-antitoxin system RelE/ParE family toxin [Acidobacteriota bacterium]MDH3525584.1 type II toxin-antitoxin system RelE/ParE family toxin [Acidobacteriota bacterium]
MTWTLRYTASAARAARKLDPAVRRRVLAAVGKLAEEPERGKPLQLTLKGLRSWRTGDFRIVYRIVESRIEILVIALGHRRDVYERLSKSLR